MPDESQGWTQEDVQALARVMGWPRIGGPSTSDLWWDATSQHAWHGEATKHLRESRGIRDHPYLFTPFTDARHDLQVLERVREVWSPWTIGRFADLLRKEVSATADFGYAIVLRYAPGCYARATLAVLREMEGQTDG